MLYEFSNYNKHGNIRTRVISWPKGKSFGINPKGFGNYIGVKVFDHAYVKVGMMSVDVVTKETLGTGSTYGNTDIDGTLYAIGYNKPFDNGLFVRAEGSYMEFDGASLTSSSGSQKITLDNLDGVAGKLSIGKSF